MKQTLAILFSVVFLFGFKPYSNCCVEELLECCQTVEVSESSINLIACCESNCGVRPAKTNEPPPCECEVENNHDLMSTSSGVDIPVSKYFDIASQSSSSNIIQASVQFNAQFSTGPPPLKTSLYLLHQRFLI